MSSPQEKLKQFYNMTKHKESEFHQFQKGRLSSKVIIVMTKWNIFWILFFQILLGFLFFGLGFIFCIKTQEAMEAKKYQVRKPTFNQLYIPASSGEHQDQSIIQSMDDLSK